MFNINLFVHKLNCFRIDESLGKKIIMIVRQQQGY